MKINLTRPLQWIVSKAISKNVAQGYSDQEAREILSVTLARVTVLVIAVLIWGTSFQILAALALWAFGEGAGWLLCLLMFFAMGGAAWTYARWSKHIVYQRPAD